jgi:uncharacterized protein (DUF2141 family)
MRFYQFVSVTIILSLLGCASQTTPTGGPKDETPPELTFSNPADGQKNFKNDVIELTFDEFIKLKDPKEEILITPSPGKNTKITAKKNKVLIEPEFPWQENTTYSISFRDGIQDLTEGNPAENLRIAFSTGDTIDSLTIEGSIGEIFTEKIPDKITVALYQSDTFNIFNHTPTYFTKSNKEGIFSIRNLKGGEYYIYAFDDKNKNLKVESKTEKFGYISKPILLDKDVDSLSINLISVDARPPAITSIRNTDKTTLVRFNKFVDSLTITLEPNSQVIYSYGDAQNEVIFYQGFSIADSIQVDLFAQDSVLQKLDTTFYLKYSETKMPSETFGLKELSENYNAATKEYNHVLSYNKPLSLINYDSIYVTIDSLNRIVLNNENLTLDTLHHTLSLKVGIEMKADTIIRERGYKPINPILKYGKGAFISIELDSSKKITKNIAIIKEDDTGMVTGKVQTKEKNYLIEIITSDNTVIEKLYNPKDINFKFLKPKEYRIRILIDTNGNRKWDAGNFEKGIEPEKIIFYKSDEGKYSFPIRANWEYGPLVIKF